MRLLLTSLVTLLGFMASVTAQPPVVLVPPYARIAWDANPDSNVSSYIVYYGVESRDYEKQVLAGMNLEMTIAGLTVGQTYYFAVTDVDAAGLESDYSDEVAFTVPQMLDIHLNPAGLYLEASVDLVNWFPRAATLVGDAWRVEMDPFLPMEFYRSGGALP